MNRAFLKSPTKVTLMANSPKTMTRFKRAGKKLNAKFRPGHLHYSPDWMVLGVNNVCNMSCKMCDVGTGYSESNFAQNLTGTRPINMPLPLITHLFDQTHRFFPKTRIGYAFTEPLVYPHLLASLEHANRLGLSTAITTNGLTLRKITSELQETGLNELFISLDGPQEIHNAIRGNANSFQWAVEGIETILRQPAPRPKVSIFCTITEWNIGHLQRFLKQFAGMDLAEIGFMHTNFTPQSVVDRHNTLYGTRYPATVSNMEQIDIDKMDLDTLWKEIQEIRSNPPSFKVTFAPNITDRPSLERFYRQPDTLYGRRCNDAFRTLMIKSNGDVIPAHGRCYPVLAGNLHQQDLKEIWNAPALGNFRTELNKAGGLLPACARCCSAF
jgi:MoaA/NifB/PqqE/SkfB family radical SAM enzyme